MNNFFENTVVFLSSSAKSLTTVISGAVAGSAPTILESVTGAVKTPVEFYFQIVVWSLTIVVAITAIITWCQKQKDRWKGKRKKQA